MLGTSKYANVDVLGSNVAVNHTGNNDLERELVGAQLESERRADRRDGNAVSDLRYEFSRRAEGRR